MNFGTTETVRVSFPSFVRWTSSLCALVGPILAYWTAMTTLMKFASVQGLAATLFLLPACSAAPPTFRVEGAENVGEQAGAFSLLGVYRSGRLVEEEWRLLQAGVSSAWGGRTCVPGYSGAYRSEATAQLEVLDSLIEKEGVTEEILQMLAPAAESDFIVVIEIYGEPPRGGVATENEGPIEVAHGSAPMTTDAPSPMVDSPRRGMEMSADVFSTKTGQTVAVLEMNYKGSSETEAFRMFSDALLKHFPGKTCASWDWAKLQVKQELDSMGLPLRTPRLTPVKLVQELQLPNASASPVEHEPSSPEEASQDRSRSAHEETTQPPQ